MYVKGTPKLTTFIQMKTKYSPDNEQQKELVKLLAEWIADAVLPYALVDNNRYVPAHITFCIYLVCCESWRGACCRNSGQGPVLLCCM